jgi:pyruvate dehydrogenase E2 component (dihydrolipoamide acetyltransferase)
MATVVIMPKQGQSVENCIITEWNKKKGEKVTKGEILFAYETDKAAFEEEAPVDGYLLEVFYEAGDEVPVLKNVCIIGEKGESVNNLILGVSVPAQKAEEKLQAVSELQKPAVEKFEPEQKQIESGAGSFISPRAKKLAEKEGIVTEGIKGSGPKGRIIEQDIRSAIGSTKTTPLAKKMAGAEQAQYTGT